MSKEASTSKKKGDALTRLIAQIGALPAQVDFVLAIVTGAFGGYAMVLAGMRFFGLFSFFLAITFLIFGGLAYSRENKRLQMLARYADPACIADMDAVALRHLLRSFYEGRGQTLETADETDERLKEIDFVARYRKEETLIRMREWDAQNIGVSSMRSVFGALHATEAAAGMLVTRGKMDEEAERFASARNIDIVGPDRLSAMICEFLGVETAVAKTPEVAKTHASTRSGQDNSEVPRFIFLDLAAVTAGQDLLAAVLNRYDRYSLVMTSGKESAREAASSLRVESSRFAGTTPDAPDAEGHGRRYHEIMEFLRNTPNGHRALWAAIDSDPRSAPEGSPEIIIANPARGITQSIADAMSNALAMGERRLTATA